MAMVEYIDKNATVGILEAMSRSTDCECIKKRLEKAAKRVRAIHASDVAPVVRCKDCKSCRKLNRKDRIEEAYADGVLWCTNQSDGVWPDDFCSYGERKGGETDGS